MNELGAEKSPYLRQHADNPVEWRAWGERAFAEARDRDRPIFLSIGYSTCHWCHVMAQESFEDPAIAKILSEDFVAIKVDREERPDVDKIYMTYVQSLTGHGGWPLSAWLTPDRKPFYGGTYFPPEEKSGRPSFAMVLQALARGWREDRAKLLQESERGVDLVLREGSAEKSGALAPEAFAEVAGAAFEHCFEYFHQSFDVRHGGFGGAPKFPRASNLEFLFRVAVLQGAASEAGKQAVQMAVSTLRGMAQGGIHDHVGGGFHRYAVDAAWTLPHFEKMLYDQAQIAVNCLEARQATGDERFAWLARDIFDYVTRDLTHPRGGFFTAEDADSAIDAATPQHREGAFYVWSAAELDQILGVDSEFFRGHFGVTSSGNIPAEQDPFQEFTGKNVLRQERALAASAAATNCSLEEASVKLSSCLEKLRAVRARRPRPLRDEKILTAQNGLMISAFARGARVLGEPTLAAVAVRAADFLAAELWDPASGKLFRTWQEGRGATEGFAEDYAFLIQALIDLYETTFSSRWLRWAVTLQETMNEIFWDDAHGGYFNSALGDTSLVARLKESYDGAEPTPTSVASLNLLRLGAIFDPSTSAAVPGENLPGSANLSYRQRGQRAIESLRSQWEKSPPSLPQLLCALELALTPPRHVVVTGDPANENFQALTAVLAEGLQAKRALVGAPRGEADAWLMQGAPWLQGYLAKGAEVSAYVCEEYSCRPPVSTPEDLRQQLRESS